MNLTAYRNYTHQLVTSLKSNPNALGLVALGSMAERSRLPDEWSDHDFFIITQTGEQHHFHDSMTWLPDHTHMLTTIRETEHGYKVIYESGHLVEFAIFDTEEIQLAKVNDYRILFDKGGISSHIEAVTVREQDDYDIMHELEMFAVLLLVGGNRAARGEELSAHMFIKSYALGHLLRAMILLLPSEHSIQLDTLDVYRRIEDVFPRKAAMLHTALQLPPIACALQLIEFTDETLQAHFPTFPRVLVDTVAAQLKRNQ